MKTCPAFLIAVAGLAGCGSSAQPDNPSPPGTMLAAGQVETGAGSLLQVSASRAFFFNYDGMGNNTLQSVPLGGGTTTTLDGNSPMAFAVDATNAYAFDTAGFVSIPGAGGTAKTIATDSASVAGLVLSGSTLYAVAVGGIQFVPADGSKPLLSVSIANTETTVTAPCAVAADAVNVYWIDCARGNLYALPVAAGQAANPVVLAQVGPGNSPLGDGGAGRAYVLTAAKGDIFWGDATEGAIKQVSASGGQVTTVTSSAGSVSALATDGTEVYFANGTALSKVAASGGAVAELYGYGASAPSILQAGGIVTGLALDEGHVYFSTPSFGVYALAR